MFENELIILNLIPWSNVLASVFDQVHRTFGVLTLDLCNVEHDYRAYSAYYLLEGSLFTSGSFTFVVQKIQHILVRDYFHKFIKLQW